MNAIRLRKKSTTTFKFYLILAILLIVAILGMGTLAYYNGNKTALNKFEGFFNNGARLHDDFEGEISQKNNLKDVYVENYGDAPLVIRVRLSEYYELGGQSLLGGQKSDTGTWEIHKPGVINAASAAWQWSMGGQKHYLPTDNLDDIDEGTGVPSGPRYADADNIVGRNWYGEVQGQDLETKGYASGTAGASGTGTSADPFSAADIGGAFTDNVFEDRSADPATYGQKTVGQTLSATVMTMAEWLAGGSQPGPFWVGDEDGWYYWAQQLEPQTATGLLLHRVDRLIDTYDDYYYGIDVTLQAVNRTETPKFSTDGGGISENGKAIVNGAMKSPAVSGSHGIGAVAMNEVYHVPRFSLLGYNIAFDFQMPAELAPVLNTAKWSVLGTPLGGFTEASLKCAQPADSLADTAHVLLNVPAGSETSEIVIRAVSNDDPGYYIDFRVEAIDYVAQAGGGGGAGSGGPILGGYADGLVGTGAPGNTDGFHTVFEVSEATKGWYAVMLRGGDGGNASGSGGAGGVVKGVVWLEPGKYTLVAGAIGSTNGVQADSNTSAFTGGGKSYPRSEAGGGGGGLSGLFLTDSTDYIQLNVLAVAGGGGGGPYKNSGQGSVLRGGYGGGGGNATTGVTVLGVSSGQDGQQISSRNQNGGGGGSSGGAGGSGYQGYNGNAGSALKGGDVTRFGNYADRAGAGGSGWFGGGSGGGSYNGSSDQTTAGGGGGGSSYIVQSNTGMNSGLVYTAVGGHSALSASLRNDIDKLIPAPYIYQGRSSGVAAVCYLGRAYPDASLYP